MGFHTTSVALFSPSHIPYSNIRPKILHALFTGGKRSKSRPILLVVNRKTSQIHTKLTTIFCTAAGLVKID